MSKVRSLTTRRVRLVHAVEKFAVETPPHSPGLIGHDDGSPSRNGKEIEVKSWGTTARRTLGILSFVAVIPAAGFAFAGHWGGGKPKGPPQEAIDACAGMSEGDTGQFATPRGDTMSGIRRQWPGTGEKLRKPAEAKRPDEAAVRTLAASQNETRVELVVSRARARSQIFALLTPEQRESARKLGPRGAGRDGHRPWRERPDGAG